MELNDVFIGRQPILDRNQRIFGYELLFRNGQVFSADVSDDVQATASVMVNALSDMGIKSLIGEKRGFINIEEKLLGSGIIELLPRDQTVIEILETVDLNVEVVDLCRKLRKKGYHFALDDFVYRESATPMFEIVEYVKMDALATDRDTLENVSQVLKGSSSRLLAEKVETREDFDYLKNLGFNLFQGYFFARPSIITAKSISPALMVLIELLGLLSREADIYLIEQLFRRHPELDIKLLRFMNSAAFYTSQKVTSIKHSIILLGYRKLQKWVTLLLFAGAEHDMETNPLLERAAIRGRVSELLAKRMNKDDATADSAFITGVLSLADALFQMPIETVLGELNLAVEIKDALIRRQGFLGVLMSIVEGLESDDLAEVETLLKECGLALPDLFSIEKTAIIEYENYKSERR